MHRDDTVTTIMGGERGDLHSGFVESKSVNMVGELVFHDGDVNSCGIDGWCPVGGHGNDAVASEGVGKGDGLCAVIAESKPVPNCRQLTGHQKIMEIRMGDRVHHHVQMHGGLASVIGNKECIGEIFSWMGYIQVGEVEVRVGGLRGTEHSCDRIVVERTDMG